MAGHILGGGNLESLLKKWVRERGHAPVEWQVPGGPPVLTVTDPDTIREAFEVLQLAKSPRYSDLLPLLGERSMVLTEGGVWRAQRDAFNPGFASPFLRDAVPQFVGCTRHLVERLDAAAAEGEAGGGGGGGVGVVLMHPLIIMLTLEVILKVGFGEDANFLDPSSGGVQHPLFSSFLRLGRHVSYYLDNPAFNWMKTLPWNKARTEQLNKEYTDRIMEVLTRRLAAMGIDASSPSAGARPGSPVASASAGGECPMRSVVGLSGGSNGSGSAAAAGGGNGSGHAATSDGAAAAVGACPAGASAAAGGSRTILDLAVQFSTAEGGGGLDVPTLRDQLMTFFAAGHDTTAALVAWTVYYLCQNPDAEARLAAEAAAVLGVTGDGNDITDDVAVADPTWQQLNEMRYMTCVLKETLRLRPPVGIIARWGPEGATLGGYDASNKVILVSPYLQHTDERVWGPDAELWRPERWEDGAADALHPYSYLPFSRGPRDCIGARFAMLEAKTILAMVYSRFSLEYAAEGPEGVLFSVTAHPARGVPVRVRRRRPVAAGEARVVGVARAEARAAAA